MEQEYPGRRSWSVLEDNDPAGLRSKARLVAKKEARINAFEIPKRSPDLNVCDFALWSEVDKGKKWLAGQRRAARPAAAAGVGGRRAKLAKGPPPGGEVNPVAHDLPLQVNKRTRLQEKRTPPDKEEARAEFQARLKRVALWLPAIFVNASLKQMRKR